MPYEKEFEFADVVSVKTVGGDTAYGYFLAYGDDDEPVIISKGREVVGVKGSMEKDPSGIPDHLAEDADPKLLSVAQKLEKISGRLYGNAWKLLHGSMSRQCLFEKWLKMRSDMDQTMAELVTAKHQPKFVQANVPITHQQLWYCCTYGKMPDASLARSIFSGNLVTATNKHSEEEHWKVVLDELRQQFDDAAANKIALLEKEIRSLRHELARPLG